MNAATENPIPLELTQAEFQRYVDLGIDAERLRACMHDVTLILPNLVARGNALAKTDRRIERIMRHYLIDCAERVLPVFEEHAPTNSGMRACIEAGRLLADGEIDHAAAKLAITSFSKSIVPAEMPDGPQFAALSIFLAVGWNWLEAEDGDPEMLQNAGWGVRFAFNASDRSTAMRNWLFVRFTESLDELTGKQTATEAAQEAES